MKRLLLSLLLLAPIAAQAQQTVQMQVDTISGMVSREVQALGNEVVSQAAQIASLQQQLATAQAKIEELTKKAEAAKAAPKTEAGK